MLLLNYLCDSKTKLILILLLKYFYKFFIILLPVIIFIKIGFKSYKFFNNKKFTKKNVFLHNKFIIKYMVLLSLLVIFIPKIVNLIFNNSDFTMCFKVNSISEINSYTKDVHLISDDLDEVVSCFGIDGCKIKLKKINKDNYDFLGWSNSKDCVDIINDELYVTSNSYLYACFR